MDQNKVNLFDYHERMVWNQRKKNLPVTLVTGFLGVGKTTLLQHILGQKRNLKIAVAVNDLAQVNIDSQIIERKYRATIGALKDVSDGCACCNKHAIFQDYVWQDIQQMDDGKFDYLLVETSGVTDPLSIIASLEKNFGKLFRAHLDTVVTVLDADTTLMFIKNQDDTSTKSVYSSFNEVLKHSSVFLSQIKLADVVLLNKTDLLENQEDIQIINDFLAKIAPGIRVIPAKYGIVPLQCVLGVSPSDSGPGAVSHDRVTEEFTINAHYSKLPAKQRILPSIEPNPDHLKQDLISSTVFTSFEPFLHSLFQKFLKSIQTGKFGKIIRIKGSIWFQNSNGRTYTFNLSGRMRFDLEIDPTLHIKQQSKNQLVIIGMDLREDDILNALSACFKDSSPINESSKEFVSTLQEHTMFQTFTQDTTQPIVVFRLVGIVEFGITIEQAENEYRINLNQMNLDLARAINMGKTHHIAIPIQIDDNVICIGIAVDEEFGSLIPGLIESAERLKIGCSCVLDSMYKLGIRFFSRISVSVRPLEISKLQPTRAALTLSPSAVKQISLILSENSQIQGLRINLRTRGCNGLAYTLQLASEKEKFDEEVIQEGLRIFIAPKALMSILGSEMDYLTDKLSSGFVFNNPNVKVVRPHVGYAIVNSEYHNQSKIVTYSNPNSTQVLTISLEGSTLTYSMLPSLQISK
ncbi:COBW domain-containing protein [Oopsacas minuta]|uniref:COBW domain-containing protein n=1 Tax=Oopsacas minuta TaxID=111878 RepID=A0AAV7JFS6_9METZ|nr:COBW domain-containing protein [Oopsacas minuta]